MPQAIFRHTTVSAVRLLQIGVTLCRVDIEGHNLGFHFITPISGVLLEHNAAQKLVES
jgi:hypothetical protein